MPTARRSAVSETLPSGSWVELQLTVLQAAERSAGVPADTRRHDYVARVRGFLVEPARVGDAASVRTLAGREIRGTLSDGAPRNPADFGDPVTELLEAGDTHRSRLGTAP